MVVKRGCKLRLLGEAVHRGGQVRLERLEDDDDEEHVSFVVTARAAAADGDQQILQRTVRVSTPIPSIS